MFGIISPKLLKGMIDTDCGLDIDGIQLKFYQCGCYTSTNTAENRTQLMQSAKFRYDKYPSSLSCIRRCDHTAVHNNTFQLASGGMAKQVDVQLLGIRCCDIRRRRDHQYILTDIQFG